MTNKNYRRGYEKELQACKELRERGYDAYRSAASHGMFDIFSVNEREGLVIQVKRVKKPCNILKAFRREIKAIEQAKVPVGIKKALWVWIDGQGWQKVVIG